MKKIVRNLMLLRVAIAMFTACGKEPEVTKQGDVTIENGAIKAAFSVSDSNHVYFSQGNLQYQASTDVWRFAETQWDYVGTQTPDANGNTGGTVNGSDNTNISENYDGWIDLFGWGTSGYNGMNPYMTSKIHIAYGDGENDLAGTNYDWGVYNKNSNGGNQAGLWRTLTKNEWEYLIDSRVNASSKYGVATVNNVNGLVLLPDSWTLPDGLTFTSGVADVYGSEYYKTVNNYSAEDWTKMEANGAVFLPAAGLRYEAVVGSVGSYGNYWSSSACNCHDAYSLNFDSSGVIIGLYVRNYGLSVRLVQDVE